MKLKCGLCTRGIPVTKQMMNTKDQLQAYQYPRMAERQLLVFTGFRESLREITWSLIHMY